MPVVSVMQDDIDREVCIVIGMEEAKEQWEWRKFRRVLSDMLGKAGTYQVVASIVILKSGDAPYARIDFPVVACAAVSSENTVYILVQGLDKFIDYLANKL
jgi:hypothetical protein